MHTLSRSFHVSWLNSKWACVSFTACATPPSHSSDSSSGDESEAAQGGGEGGSPTAPTASPLHPPSPTAEGVGPVDGGVGLVSNGDSGKEHTLEGIFGDADDISSS